MARPAKFSPSHQFLHPRSSCGTCFKELGHWLSSFVRPGHPEATATCTSLGRPAAWETREPKAHRITLLQTYHRPISQKKCVRLREISLLRCQFAALTGWSQIPSPTPQLLSRVPHTAHLTPSPLTPRPCPASLLFPASRPRGQ